MTVLVVGATGELGGTICRRLCEKGVRVRGLVRPDSQKAQGLTTRGVEVVHGDLKEPSSLEAACRGVDAVISTATCILSRRRGDTLRRVDRDGQLALVAAARQAGARRFVFVSVSPNLPANCPFVRYKREAERAMRASGLAWTVLQPSAFMETALGPLAGWDLKAGKVRVVGAGNAPISYICRDDVAAFAVQAVEHPRAANRDLPLGGPQALSPLDVVRQCEDVFGRAFRIRHMPAWPFHAGRALLRPFSPVAVSICALIAASARGDVIDMATTTGEFPVRLTTVREYLVAAGATTGATAAEPDAAPDRGGM